MPGRNISSGRSAKCPIHTRSHAESKGKSAAPHSRLLVGGGVEFPEVIQVSVGTDLIKAFSAKKPEVALAVRPRNGLRSTTRSIPHGGRAQCPVIAGALCGDAPAHSRPFIRADRLRSGGKSSKRKPKQTRTHPPRRRTTSSHSHWSFPFCAELPQIILPARRHSTRSELVCSGLT